MLIKDIHLEVIQADVDSTGADVKIVECRDLNQDSMRKTIAQALQDAQSNGHKSLAFTDLGSKAASFPLVGAAKIMVQEVMRFTRDYGDTTLNKIVFCLQDSESFHIFDQTIHVLRFRPSP